MLTAPGNRGHRTRLTARSDLFYSLVEKGCVKVRDIVKLIEDDGWFLVVTKGSHRQYKHPSKPGRVTIAGHPGDDIAPGTHNSILKQAKLKEGK